MGKHELIFSVGFGKGAQREYAVWDPKNLSQPLLPFQSIDNSAGVIAPFYDEDSDLVFLAGKGDGNVRFYEVIPEEEPKKMVVYCSQYSSNDSGAAYGAAPKRACDVNANEIMRIYKVLRLIFARIAYADSCSLDHWHPGSAPPVHRPSQVRALPGGHLPSLPLRRARSRRRCLARGSELQAQDQVSRGWLRCSRSRAD